MLLSGSRRRTVCRLGVASMLLLVATGSPTNATEAECEVFAPDHGFLGDCPELLQSGASCQPSCETGYRPSGSAECTDGNLSMVACLPKACNVSEARSPGCATVEVLESGQACEPDCEANWSAASLSTCHLGDFTPGKCVLCPSGKTFNVSARACEECPFSTYKAEPGNGTCVPCPVGSQSTMAGADSWNVCVCNYTTYHVDKVGVGEPFVCEVCPDHAHVEGGREGTSAEDCKCTSPYIKEVNDTTQQMQQCRLPHPCPLKTWLAEINLTGNAQYNLQLGDCAEYTVNDTGLPSGEVCHLECPDRTAAQVKADLFSAVNRDIVCEDGVIINHPPAGTWCSEASWTLPPLVFLVSVTIVAFVAMANIERRQQTFEQECSLALASGTVSSRGSKRKLA